MAEPADNGQRRAPMFSGYRFAELARSGLFVPDAALEAIQTEAEEVSKALGRETRLARRMGSLFNLYHSVWTNIVQWGAADKPRFTPTHRFLREVARKSLLDALIVNARLFQMRHVARRVIVEGKQKGWNVVHKQHSNPAFANSADIKRRCNEVEQFLERGLNPEVHPGGFRDLLVKAVQGELIIDRKVLIMAKGQDGRPRRFHTIPPDHVKPRFETLLSFMQRDGYPTEQDAMIGVWQQQRIDLTDKAYVQVLDDGRIGGAWTAEECSVDITNPSDEIDRWGYGVCVPYDTRIETDRGLLMIGRIVADRLPVQVRSWNREQQRIEWRRVTGWSQRKELAPLVRLMWGATRGSYSAGGRGNVLRCTAEHPVLTPKGWRRADSVAPGDDILVVGPALSADQEQIILGGLLGDGSLVRHRGVGTPYYQTSQGGRHHDYADWTAHALASLGVATGKRRSQSPNGCRGRAPGRPTWLTWVRTRAQYCLWPLWRLAYDPNGRKHVRRDWLDRIGPLGLAVWAMDDGSLSPTIRNGKRGQTWRCAPRLVLCTDSFSRAETQEIVQWFSERWGIGARVQCPPSTGRPRVRLTTGGTRRFLELVSPYLGADATGEKWWTFAHVRQGSAEAPVPVKITSRERFRGRGQTSVFDLEVDGTHSFLVNNAIVHNSCLERSLEATTILMMALNYNRGAFTQNYPEAFLVFNGEVDPAGLEAFKRQMYAEVGPGGNQRLPVIATGSSELNKAQLLKLRDSLRDMQYPQLVRMAVALKTAAYRAHPCLRFEAQLHTPEGPRKIGTVVRDKLPARVKSFDAAKRIVWSQVTGWTRHSAREWVKLWFPGPRHYRTLEGTTNHRLETDRGLITMDKIAPGDRLAVLSPTLTPEQEQVLLGSLLGDGNLSIARWRHNTASRYARHHLVGALPRYVETHAALQRDYLAWKAEAFRNLAPSLRDVTHPSRPTRPAFEGTTLYLPAAPVLWLYRDLCYSGPGGSKRLTAEWLARLGPLGLAIWLMDDGDITQRSFGLRRRGARPRDRASHTVRLALPPMTETEVRAVAEYFRARWDVSPRLTPARRSRGWHARFTVADSARLLEACAPYMRPLNPKGKAWVAGAIPAGVEEGLAYVPVVRTKAITRRRPCYDIEVEGTHTFIVNGVASSNSLVNFAPDSGGQRPIISNETQEQQIALAQEEGLHSILDNLGAWLTRTLVEPWYDDLELVWTVQDEPTAQERVEIGKQKLEMGMTVDEWRATEGLKPLATVTQGAQDGAYVNSPFFFQAVQLGQQQQAAEQEAALAQMGQGAGPGGPQAPAQEEDGFAGMEPPPPKRRIRVPGQPPDRAGRGRRPPAAAKSLRLVLED